MFVPVLITLCGDIPSLDPVQLVLPVTLATTFGYSLPSASGRMALMSASGIVSRGKMMHYGLIMTVISSVVLAMPTEDMGLGQAPGTDILADALREEIAATADVPVIEVARIAG